MCRCKLFLIVGVTIAALCYQLIHCKKKDKKTMVSGSFGSNGGKFFYSGGKKKDKVMLISMGDGYKKKKKEKYLTDYNFEFEKPQKCQLIKVCPKKKERTYVFKPDTKGYDDVYV